MNTEIEKYQLQFLRVSDLFGRFNYRLVFHETDNIAIVTAPNGYGKTVLLRILDSVFNKKLAFFRTLEFREIEIGIGSNKTLLISKAQNGTAKPVSKVVEFRGKGFGPGSQKHSLSKQFTRSDFRYIERHLPVEAIGPDQWLDYSTDKTLSTDQVVHIYSEHFPSRLRPFLSIPNWLKRAMDSINVHFVETQRLLHLDDAQERRSPRRRAPMFASVVERDASDLSERIGRLLQEYANESQKLDQTFPERILDFRSGTVSGEEEIRAALKELTQKREELISVGLLGSTISEPIRPSETLREEIVRRILEIYVDDTGNKLKIFDETYEKIGLFKQILNERFSFKEIEIDPQYGIRAIDSSNEQPIPLSELSSGEQHELVLLYDLLFAVEEDSLILIDEPELSLHVLWQKKFISDLQRIQNLKNLKVLIATHSPQIIHDKWHLVQELTN